MLGAELRAVRQQRGLTIEQVAERAKMSRAAIGAVERGVRYPSLETLEGLAEALDIRIVIGPLETHIEP